MTESEETGSEQAQNEPEKKNLWQKIKSVIKI